MKKRVIKPIIILIVLILLALLVWWLVRPAYQAYRQQQCALLQEKIQYYEQEQRCAFPPKSAIMCMQKSIPPRLDSALSRPGVVALGRVVVIKPECSSRRFQEFSYNGGSNLREDIDSIRSCSFCSAFHS